MSMRLPASERREQLLDVALEVFARQGFHGTSMNEIADAAGVTKPVLYQHFDAKRDLYLALLESVGGRLIDGITKVVAQAPDGRRQTELGFRGYFRWVHDSHDAFMLLFGGEARRDAEFSEAVNRVEDHIAEAIAPLIAVDTDPTHRLVLAYGLVGLAEGVSRKLLSASVEFDPDQVAAQVSELAWAGLRGVQRH